MVMTPKARHKRNKSPVVLLWVGGWVMGGWVGGMDEKFSVTGEILCGNAKCNSMIH